MLLVHRFVLKPLHAPDDSLPLGLRAAPASYAATGLGRADADVHPRWDRSGARVGVDSCENGVRQMQIVNARTAVAQFQ